MSQVPPREQEQSSLDDLQFLNKLKNDVQELTTRLDEQGTKSMIIQ